MRVRIIVICLVLASPGCGSAPRTIKVPKELLTDSMPPARAETPYVIKMSDGQRTWQIEIPAGAGSPAFEASIPLRLDGTDGESLVATEADREILDAKRAAGEEVAAAETEAPSYLRALNRVRQLYRKSQFELALVELVKAERQFPEDRRILEMKGTLLARLGRTTEAREVWRRALARDPEDPVLLQALEGLEERGE
ncbi:MAG: tetratricopeptide repeat protein [Myxococcota bacterium]